MGTHALLDDYRLHVGKGPEAHGLRTFTESRGIRTFAYGAVGEPGPSKELLSSPVLKRIGDAHMRSPEEVALRWVLQTGAAVSVRPTTDFGLGVSTCNGPKCEAGIAARASSCSWSLTANDMAELNALTAPDDNPTLFSSSGCPGAFGMRDLLITTIQSLVL
jgi:diketogulonate reductase-like aldo/keto reductase